MRNASKIILGVLLLVVAGSALAALTITLAGPATYADPQWRSVCISNLNGGANYTATIEVCPSDEVQGVTGACITHSVSSGTLPAAGQTIVNYMIGQWTTANPQYAPP